MTKYMSHKALKLIASGKLTYGERSAVHRVLENSLGVGAHPEKPIYFRFLVMKLTTHMRLNSNIVYLNSLRENERTIRISPVAIENEFQF